MIGLNGKASTLLTNSEWHNENSIISCWVMDAFVHPFDLESIPNLDFVLESMTDLDHHDYVYM